MDLVSVRPAVQADAGPATDVWLRSRRDALESIPATVHSDDEVAQWIACRVIAELECWVAETTDRTVVGLVALEDGWVDQLYVTPGWQARGVGSALLDQAKRLRPRGLQLWTFASNLRARRFYEQRGFIAVEETDGSENEERAPALRYAWVPSGQAESR